MNPNEAKREFDRADALYREKRYPEALQLLDELEALHPLNRNIMYPRALCLAALGRTDDALQVCDMLVALFQDTRAQELKAQIQASVKPGPGKPSPRRAGKGFQFPTRNVAIALAVVGVGALAFFFFTHRQAAGPGDKTADRSKQGASQTGASAQAQEEIDKAIRQHMETSQDPPFAALYDTGTSSKEPLTPDNLTSRAGWTEVAEEKTDHAFQGDAVLMNNQVIVVLRKEGTGAEICGRKTGFQKTYANLVPGGGTSTAQGITSLAVAKCGQDEVIVEASHGTGGAEILKVRYQLAMGQVSVKVTPVEGATRLRVEARSRFAVLPDFFADDLVVDARDIQGDTAEVPSENFLLHMLGDGEAIVMDVWDNRDQDVRLVLGGQGQRREIQSSEVAFGKEGAVWVALLADRGMWHTRDIMAEEKGVELPLNWQCPYPALWRVDWQYSDKLSSDKLTDSWEMLTETSPGNFKKHGMFQEDEDAWTAQDWWGSGPRTRIASGLGRFNYPCWVDLQGQGWLEPLSTESWLSFQPMNGVPEFQGPALIYPINRISDTPLDKFTVVDVVRASLGVGPCQYILDVEGQSETFSGMPTCSVQEILDEMYEAGQQKQRGAEVEKALDDVVAFISMIRDRIDQYAAFSKEMQTFLQDSGKKYAEQSAFIAKMQALTARIDTAIAERLESIKTVDYAAKLAKEFRSELVGYDGDDAAEKCKTFTKGWVEIGGNQDVLVAECRVAVKRLRQRAALGLTSDPNRAELVGEIRARTEKILRAPVNYEAPRH